MAAPNYDEMDAESDETAAEDTAEEDTALDDELMMHAADAGLDEAKAKAMKAFVERCVELKETGGYAAAEDDLEELL
jgi:hypothetical protein